MGVDAVIGVEGAEWDDEPRLAEVVLELIQRESKPGWPSPPPKSVNGWLEITGLARYYGPGYERGHWPNLYAAIRAVRALFPGHRVTYGGDGSQPWENPDATDEYLAAIWGHWLSEEGDDYGKASREANRRTVAEAWPGRAS